MRYQTKYDKGDRFILNGKFKVVMDVRHEPEPEYLISERGKWKWKDAALVDRNATEYNDISQDGKVV